MLDVLTIGDVSLDTFLMLDEGEVEINGKLLTLAFGAKIPVKQVAYSMGGNAANVAVGLSRLGFRAGIVTALGADGLAEHLRADLAKDGVSLKYARRQAGSQSNHSTVLSSKGERSIFIHHEPRQYLWPAKIEPSSWVYLTSMAEGAENLFPAILHYIDKSGAKLALAPGTFQLRLPLPKLRGLLKQTEVLFLNLDEAERLAAKVHSIPKLSPATKRLKHAKLLAQLKALGPSAVIVTDGQNGAWAVSDGVWFRLTLNKKRPDKESTGAGDAFATGVLAGLLRGQALPEALNWGIEEAASVVQQIGAEAGLLTEYQLKERLNHHQPICKIRTEVFK